MITRHIVVIILKYIEIYNHYFVYQELIWCCRSMILQKETKQRKSWKKETRFVGTTGRVWGEGELDEGSQKVQTSSNKINKY